MKKIAWLLVVAMLMQSVPMNVMAEETTQPVVMEEANVEEIAEDTEEEQVEEIVEETPEETVVEETKETEEETGIGEEEVQESALGASEFTNDTVITSEHIPDASLMLCIKDKLGKGEDDVITYGDLQTITYFDSYNMAQIQSKSDAKWNDFVPVESIKGLELLKKAQRIYLAGHNISDITPIKDLTELKTVNLESNKITSLPDLSAWTKVTSFSIEFNKIPAEDIKQNYPANIKTDSRVEKCVTTQRSDELRGEKTAHVYYDTNLKAHYPLDLKADIIYDREYTYVSAKVNGVDATSAFKMNEYQYSNSNYPYYHGITGDAAEFVEGGSTNNKLQLVLKDQYNEVYEYEFAFDAKDLEKAYEAEADSPIMISAQDALKAGVMAPTMTFVVADKDVKVSKVALVDSTGNEIGSVTNLTDSNDYYQGNNFRYSDQHLDTQLARLAMEYSEVETEEWNWEKALNYIQSRNTNFYPKNEMEDGLYSLVWTLSDGTTYTLKNRFQAVSNPVVFTVDDTDTYNSSSRFKVDQTGDYISVYVYGLNLSKATTTPVFVDGEGNKISGEVEATEKDSNGVFYRMKKLESDVWTDWTESSYSSEVYKYHNVNIEFAEGVDGKDLRTNNRTYIEKNGIYFNTYNHLTGTYTFWLESDTDIDKTVAPVLRVGTKEYNNQIYEYELKDEIYSKTGKLVEGVNPLTNASEKKLEFTMSAEEYQKIYDAWNCMWEVSYQDSEGKNCITKSEDIRIRKNDELTTVSSKHCTVLYLPYWIGAVHEIEAGSNKYYLTDADLNVLGGHVFAQRNYYGSATGNLNESSAPNRSEYSLYVCTKPDFPAAPAGKSKLTITTEGTESPVINFNWTAVEGASYYEVRVGLAEEVAEALGMESVTIGTTSGLSYRTYQEVISEFIQMGAESGADISSVELYIVPIAQGKGGITTVGQESNRVIYKYGEGVCEHNWTKKVTTDATFTKDGVITKTCTKCSETETEALAKVSNVKLSYTLTTYSGSTKTPTVTVKDANGDALDKSDYTVTYASGRKSVGQYKVTVKLQNEYSGTKTLTFKIQPKAPTNVKAKLYGHNDVKVSWTKATGAKGYYVYYKKTSAKNYGTPKMVTGSYRNFSNLSDGVGYTFKVVPYYEVNGTKVESTKSVVVSATTLKKLAAPTVTKSSSSKVKVKWVNIAGETGYQISRSTSKTGTSIQSTYATTSGTSKTISATKKKVYYYKVRAYKTVDGKKIYGPWSSVTKYTLK